MSNTSPSLFARVQDNAILEYPITLEDLKSRNESLSLFKQVQYGPKPDYQAFHRIVEKLEMINRIPTLSYSLQPLTVDEILEEMWRGHETMEVSDVPPGAFARITTLIRAEIGAKLDEFAQTRDYDGIVSLCSYFGDPDPQHVAEAQRGMFLRSRCWTVIRSYEQEVATGQSPVPRTKAEMLSRLPQLTWED